MRGKPRIEQSLLLSSIYAFIYVYIYVNCLINLKLIFFFSRDVMRKFCNYSRIIILWSILNRERSLPLSISQEC